MSEKVRVNLLSQVRKLATLECDKHSLDRELLGRYVATGDQQAFAAVVRRHGAMVLRVCQRVLGNAADADDAFQATFVVLMRKAKSIRWQTSIANWLYGVAYRICLDARKSADRRRRHERAVGASAPQDLADHIAAKETQAIVDEELATMSEQHRAPLVLCYLESATHEEAAEQLGWSLATLKRRLCRGLDILEARLRSRGLAVPAALLTAAIAGTMASASVSAAAMTGVLANLAAAGTGTAPLAGNVAFLADRCIRGILLSRVKSMAVILGISATLVAGVGWMVAPLLNGAPGDERARAVLDAPLGAPPGPQGKAEAPALGRADVKKAQDTADKLEEDQLKLHLLVRLAPAQAKAGEAALAKKTLRDAAALAARLDAGVEFPSLMVNVIGALAEAGFAADAVQTIADMPNPYDRPGTLAEVAAHQGRRGEFAGAQKTIDAIIALRAASFPPQRPGARSQQTVIDESLAAALRNLSWSHIAVKDPLAALKAVRKIPRDADRIAALTDVAPALAKQGFPVEAQQALHEARTLYQIVSAVGWQCSRDEKYALACIASAQVRLGDLDGAALTAAPLDGETKDSYLRTLARAHIQVGDFAKAEDIARILINVSNRHDVVLALCSAKVRRGDGSTAVRDAERLLDGSDRIRAFAELAPLLVETGEPAEAARILVKARDLAVAARRDDPKCDLRWTGHREVARAFALSGMRADAEAWAATETPAVRAWVLLGIAEGELRKEAKAKLR